MPLAGLLYVYLLKGIAGVAPDQHGLYLTRNQHDLPRPRSTWDGESHWVLVSTDQTGPSPLKVLVFYEGLPSQDERADIKARLQVRAGRLLTETNEH